MSMRTVFSPIITLGFPLSSFIFASATPADPWKNESGRNNRYVNQWFENQQGGPPWYEGGEGFGDRNFRPGEGKGRFQESYRKPPKSSPYPTGPSRSPYLYREPNYVPSSSDRPQSLRAPSDHYGPSHSLGIIDYPEDVRRYRYGDYGEQQEFLENQNEWIRERNEKRQKLREKWRERERELVEKAREEARELAEWEREYQQKILEKQRKHQKKHLERARDQYEEYRKRHYDG